MVLNNWVGFFTCLKKKPQKFLWWSRRMLKDGAVHSFIVRAGLKVLLAAERNLKCCFLAKFRQ